MNKYEEILGSVSARRLRGSLTLVEIAVENRVCLFPPRPLRVSRPTWDLNGELSLRESCSVAQNACLENNSMRDASAQLRFAHPKASTSNESLT